MKTMLKYILPLALLLSLFCTSCNKDEETNKDKEDQPIDYGELKGDYLVKSFDGKVITSADMGEQIFFFDVSKGRPDARSWTLTGSTNETSDQIIIATSYPKPGIYPVKLAVSKKDGTEDVVELANGIEILSIPIEATFATNLIPEGGVINIKTGDYITYSNMSSGVPETFEWTLDGGTPEISTEENPTVRYETSGVYDVQLTARRNDNGTIVEDDTVMTAYINVQQRVIDAKLAVYDGNKINLKFTEPIMNNLSAVNIADFSVDVTTGAGANIAAAVTNITTVDGTDNKVVLSLDQPLYDDDFVTLNFTNSGSFIDATGLTQVSNFNIGCHGIYDNVLDQSIHSFENQDKKFWLKSKNNYEFSQEVAYDGEYSLKLTAAGGENKLEVQGVNPDSPIDAGDYYYYIRVFVAEGTAPVLNTFIKKPWGNLKGLDFGTAPKGKWVEFKKKYTIKGIQQKLIFKTAVMPAGGVVMYIDDVGFFNTNLRP